jgi:hypothetical protein
MIAQEFREGPAGGAVEGAARRGIFGDDEVASW